MQAPSESTPNIEATVSSSSHPSNDSGSSSAEAGGPISAVERSPASRSHRSVARSAAPTPPMFGCAAFANPRAAESESLNTTATSDASIRVASPSTADRMPPSGARTALSNRASSARRVELVSALLLATARGCEQQDRRDRPDEHDDGADDRGEVHESVVEGHGFGREATKTGRLREGKSRGEAGRRFRWTVL